MKIRKKEIILFGILLVLAIAAMIVMNHKRNTTDHGSIRITVDGVLFGEYSLNKDQKIKINGTNTCRIKNGSAQMIEATCPDHLCIHQYPIDEKGGMIICLPNKVIIEGIPSDSASEDDGVDIIAD